MQISITGHRIEVTPALRSFTEEKFHKLMRHYDKITATNVILDVEKLRHIAEANILVSKETIHASAESEDLYAAIDLLIDKLDRQLIKHKEKIHNYSHNNIHNNHQDRSLDDSSEI